MAIQSMEEERRQWLETLAEACERVLADGTDPTEHEHAALREDVAGLLDRLRAELRAR